MDPFSSPPPAEVLLTPAPLIRVVAQVRFPSILAITEQSFVAGFQESIRNTYPILRPEQSQSFAFTPMGVQPVKPEVTWRFFSDPEETWRVSLTPTFLSVETTRYTCREDFVARLRVVVAALQAKFDPKFTERIGVRYINRLSGQEMTQLSTFVRPELLGLLGQGGNVLHQMSEMMAEVEGTRLAARWGSLPVGTTYDIDPITTESWLLDIDSFVEKIEDAAVDSIVARAVDLSEKAYTFFRWVMTPEFIASRGEGA